VTAGYRPDAAWTPVPQIPEYTAARSKLIAPLAVLGAVLLLVGAMGRPPVLVAGIVAIAVALGLVRRWRVAAATARGLNASAARRPGRHARQADQD
jgi:hypothetical protein